MINLFFLYYLSPVLLELLALYFYLIRGSKYPYEEVSGYLSLFLSALLINALVNGAGYYLMNRYPTPENLLQLKIIHIFAMSLMNYVVFRLFKSVNSLYITRIDIPMLSAALLPLIMLMLLYIGGKIFWLDYAAYLVYAILFLQLTGFYIYTLVRYKKITESLSLKLAEQAPYLILLFIPFALADMFPDRLRTFIPRLPEYLSFTPVFHLIAAGAVLKIRLGNRTEKRAEKVVKKKDPVTRYSITARELDIINEIKSGSSNREIALKKQITMTTVKKHISNIYQKTGVKNRDELLALFNDNQKSKLK